MYRYQVVPFMGKIIKGKQGMSDVANQLESLINKYATDGWEFVQLGEVDIEVAQGGCLGFLFGAKPTYMTYNQVVFRKIME